MSTKPMQSKEGSPFPTTLTRTSSFSEPVFLAREPSVKAVNAVADVNISANFALTALAKNLINSRALSLVSTP